MPCALQLHATQIIHQSFATLCVVSTAGIQSALEEDAATRALAVEVVELCGLLALTVAIAGGMISEFGGDIDESFVEHLREEGLQVTHNSLASNHASSFQHPVPPTA